MHERIQIVVVVREDADGVGEDETGLRFETGLTRTPAAVRLSDGHSCSGTRPEGSLRPQDTPVFPQGAQNETYPPIWKRGPDSSTWRMKRAP